MAKLLIVDDEDGILEEVKAFFEEEGHEVFIADSCKDGIEAIRTLQPDILVLDIKLPDMSGLEALKFCRTNSPRTKILVNTGYVDQSIIDEAERIGRDAFIPKPFNLLKLKEEIDILLGQ